MNLLRLPRLWLAASLFLLFANAVQAQTADKSRETALQFLQENASKFGLTKADVTDVRVTDEYFSKNLNVTHVWVQQQHHGIPVFNGLFGLHVKTDGNVLTTGHRFVPELASKVNTTLPSMSASKAVEMTFANLGFTDFPAPSLRQKINEQNFVFEGGAVSKKDIPVSACYERQKDGSLRLAWRVVIAQANTSDVWNFRVDAQTGLILNKNNYTVYCKAGHAHSVGEAETCEKEAVEQTTSNEQPATVLAESYNVFALPVESPAHGARQIVTNPADPTASPFGWHDTNGAAGAEYTYTRGNNIWAYDDRNDDDTGTPAESAEGGASLNFDFPFEPNGEPFDNDKAAVTNLFYMTNMMHDITYRFGFDEEAGNYQENNYGNGGLGGDYIVANAMDGAGLASPSVNNAFFSPAPDGQNGGISMFVWTRSGGQLLTVEAPSNVAGSYSASAASGWGAQLTDIPVTGPVEIVNDGSASPTLGCNPLINDLTGKIALIDRTVCQFGVKALNAENAGAIGCIICNFEEDLVQMGAGTTGSQVSIPVIMLTKSNCDLIRQYAGNGLVASLVLPASAGPELLDGDFDNGIIAHEYGHGVSIRLTGGPSTIECLFNGEQMGEGWSDWFALVTSVKPGDVAEKKRGVGTYVLRESNDGIGIRRFPYSKDMSINPHTFATVAESSGQHAIGEIWATVTWDLYWAMVEKYGFDANLSNPNSGNARAIQLVMDGMKLQPCFPGFIDGRDAIMAADVLNYNGADTCLISSVFARRGMGYLADQGSSDDSGDGIENFEPIPTCIKEVKIKKTTSTPLIDPGQNVQFTITVTNHRDETAANIVVTDELPAGLTFASASNGGTFSNGLVTWNIGNMPTGQVITLTYTAKSANLIGSQRYFHEQMEADANDNWISNLLAGAEQFNLQSTVAHTGSYAWKGVSQPTETEYTLEPVDAPLFTVTGAKPVMRFWHQYQTQKTFDAGIVEVQKSGETTWQIIPADKVFRNPYAGPVDYNTFALPGLSGFSGNSNGWVQSYMDLSDYAGQQIIVRFRFGTNDDGVNPQPEGFWYIDEIEVMDMLNLDGEACVRDDNGIQACAKAPARGVIVQPGLVGTDDPGANQLPMQVQPNPAFDFLYVTPGQSLTGQVRIELVSADGRTVLSRQMDGLSEGQIVALDVQQIPAGIYMVRLESAAGSSVKKVVIR